MLTAQHSAGKTIHNMAFGLGVLILDWINTLAWVKKRVMRMIRTVDFQTAFFFLILWKISWNAKMRECGRHVQLKSAIALPYCCMPMYES